MPLVEILIGTLGAPLAKLLLKNYLEDPAEAVGLSLIDLTKKKIEGRLEQRTVQRQFEDLGDKIAAHLASVFRETDDLSAEAISYELAKALDGHLSADFFLRHDLEPTRLAAELRRVHPLPKGHFSAAEEQLYERGLVEIARYVVEIVSKLPKFEVTSNKASLQRLTHIGDIVEETAKSVRQIENWVRKQETDTENQGYETEYRLAVGRTLDYVELFGADLSMESKRQSLSVAYVSLNLESLSGRGEEGGSESFAVQEVLDSMSAESGRLLIRGDAGSGKSTLFRWTAIEASRGIRLPDIRSGKLTIDESKISDFWQAKIPFLIRLRDCKGGKLPPPDDFPELIAKELGKPPSNWVRQVLEAGRGLVLLDGIDEIPNLYRGTAQSEIEAIVRTYPRSYFLVSTRPEAIPEGWLSGLGFREARVNPMSDWDRERFIDKWHEALAEQLERMGRSATALSELAEELKRQLLDNPPVARLATNPLLCAMICALHRDRSQKLPESQSELCEALCEVLLHRRELESDLDLSSFPEPYRRLSYPQKRAIIQEIAYNLVLNAEHTLPLRRALEITANTLHILVGFSGEEAEVVLYSIVERSGMLREVMPGRFDFIHNTLKEYLAAERFANQDDAGILVHQASFDPVWQSVLLFSVATRRRGFADKIIRHLLEMAASLQDEDLDRYRYLLLLALKCRYVTLFLGPEIDSALAGYVEGLFPPRSTSEAEALALGGDAIISYLEYNPRMGANEAVCCIRTLRLVGTRRARRALEGYREDKRKAVVGELSQAINPLLLKAVQEILRKGEGLPKDLACRVTDLSPLTGWCPPVLNLSHVSVSDLTPLAGCGCLEALYLSGVRVADFSPLSGLVNLRELDLSSTSICNLEWVSALLNLRRLDVSDSLVNDTSPLSGLFRLQYLYLRNTPVSTVESLANLESLELLDLSGTAVGNIPVFSASERLWVLLPDGRRERGATCAGVENLVAALPSGNMCDFGGVVCSNCGEPILDAVLAFQLGRGCNWAFCSHCGFRLEFKEVPQARLMDGVEQTVKVSIAAVLHEKRVDGRFDVFLCHNNEDKQSVIEIGLRLKEKGILPWLDEWELRPGLPWQRILEGQIEKIGAAAVFLGKNGLGPWQDFELDGFLREFARRECPVMPVVLAECKKLPKLPLFLGAMTWVDFRRQRPDPLEQLIWGITGQRGSQ